jgi:hypothetical protein
VELNDLLAAPGPEASYRASADGKLLAEADGTVQLWDPATGRPAAPTW